VSLERAEVKKPIQGHQAESIRVESANDKFDAVIEEIAFASGGEFLGYYRLLKFQQQVVAEQLNGLAGSNLLRDQNSMLDEAQRRMLADRAEGGYEQFDRLVVAVGRAVESGLLERDEVLATLEARPKSE
jgi:hypothetical protein